MGLIQKIACFIFSSFSKCLWYSLFGLNSNNSSPCLKLISQAQEKKRNQVLVSSLDVPTLYPSFVSCLKSCLALLFLSHFYFDNIIFLVRVSVTHCHSAITAIAVIAYIYLPTYLLIHCTCLIFAFPSKNNFSFRLHKKMVFYTECSCIFLSLMAFFSFLFPSYSGKSPH